MKWTAKRNLFYVRKATMLKWHLAKKTYTITKAHSSKHMHSQSSWCAIAMFGTVTVFKKKKKPSDQRREAQAAVVEPMTTIVMLCVTMLSEPSLSTTSCAQPHLPYIYSFSRSLMKGSRSLAGATRPNFMSWSGFGNSLDIALWHHLRLCLVLGNLKLSFYRTTRPANSCPYGLRDRAWYFDNFFRWVGVTTN